MITLASILTLLSKAEPILDLFKKHWKLLIQVAPIIWVIICLLNHCNPPPASEPVRISQPIPVIAPKIPEPTFNEPRQIVPVWSISDQPTISNASGASDSVKQLLVLTDWLQNELYGCDSTYRSDTDIRSYSDTLETDSIWLAYSIDVSGKLTTPPSFSVKPTFTFYSEPATLNNPRFIYFEGSVGPCMSYAKPIRPLAIGGSIGLGYTTPNGWSYGVRLGASQLDWSAEAAIRKSFAINLPKWLRNRK